jgi:hypothetical protein
MLSLLNTCVKIINSDVEHIKRLKLLESFDGKDSFDVHQWIKENYDHHSGLIKLGEKASFYPLDKLPKITQQRNKVIIKLPNHLMGSFNDWFVFKKKSRDQTKYNTGSIYGNRCIKIVKMVQNAIKENNNIIIDLRDCGGGDFDLYVDAFSELVGYGILYSVSHGMYCWRTNNGVLKYAKKDKIKTARYVDESAKKKNITILINEKSGSSAEFIPMIIKANIKNTKIIGKHSAGFLSSVKSHRFTYNGVRYVLLMTITKYIKDANGKKYYGTLR